MKPYIPPILIIALLLFIPCGCSEKKSEKETEGTETPTAKPSPEDQASAAYEQGLKMQAEKKYTEAEKLFKDALEKTKKPNNRNKIIVSLANLYQLTRRHDEACEYIEIALKPENNPSPITYMYASRIYTTANKPAKAYKILRHLINLSKGKDKESVKKMKALLAKPESTEKIISAVKTDLAKNPSDIEANASLAILYMYGLKQPAEAVQYYEKLITTDTKNKMRWLSALALACNKAGNKEREISAHEEMLEIPGLHPHFKFEITKMLVRLCREQKNMKAVRRHLDGFADTHKKDGSTWTKTKTHYLALQYKYLGDLEKATKYLGDTVKLETEKSQKAVLMTKLGLWQIENKDYEKARKTFVEIIKIPTIPTQHTIAALGYFEASKQENTLDQKMNELEAAIKAKPGDPAALFLALTGYMTRTCEAKKAGRTCVELIATFGEPGTNRYDESLHKIYGLTRNNQSASRRFPFSVPRIIAIGIDEELLKAAPENMHNMFLANIAASWKKIGDNEKWIATLKRIKNPHSHELHTLGKAYMENGQYNAALKVFEKITDRQADTDMVISLARTLIKLQQREKAEKLLMKRLEKRSDFAELVRLLLETAHDNGSLPQILKSAADKLAKDEKDCVSRCIVARSELILEKDFDKALPHLEKLHKTDPYDILLSADLYIACAAKKREKDCAKILSEFNNRYAPNQIHKTIAEEYLIIGDADKAKSAIEKHIENSNNPANACVEAADLFQKHGREKEALSFYDKAVKLSSDKTQSEAAALKKAQCLAHFKRYEKARAIINATVKNAHPHSDAAHLGKALLEELKGK